MLSYEKLSVDDALADYSLPWKTNFDFVITILTYSYHFQSRGLYRGRLELMVDVFLFKIQSCRCTVAHCCDMLNIVTLNCNFICVLVFHMNFEKESKLPSK